jgi:hypothetical protein
VVRAVVLALLFVCTAIAQEERGTVGITFGWNVPWATNAQVNQGSGGPSFAVHGEWHPAPLIGLGVQVRTGTLFSLAGSNIYYSVVTNISVAELGLRFLVGRTTGPWAALDFSMAFPMSRELANGSMEASWGATSIPSFSTALQFGWRIPITFPWTLDLEFRGVFLLPATPSDFPVYPVLWIQPALGVGYRF